VIVELLLRRSVMADSKAVRPYKVEHKDPRVFRAVTSAIRAPKDPIKAAAAQRAISEEAAALMSGILARARQKVAKAS
jgi:hypothetical protein